METENTPAPDDSAPPPAAETVAKGKKEKPEIVEPPKPEPKPEPKQEPKPEPVKEPGPSPTPPKKKSGAWTYFDEDEE